jgi:hypothetical protein
MSKPTQMNLGKLGDALYAKNEQIALANEAVKVLEGEKRELEAQLLAAMTTAGTDIVRGDLATVSVSELMRPQLQDWAKFEQFVLRKKALHLFEKRIAVNAYKEMKESLHGKDVPGVTEYNYQRLNVRKI